MLNIHRILLVLAALAGTALACQVPVFRFALERWEADDYRVVVFEKGPRSAATAALIERLRHASRHAETGAGTANLSIEIADIDHLTDAQQWSLLGWEEITAFPAMQVYYPDSTGVETPLWQGNLNDAAIDALVASPARAKLVDRLTSGDSAVWILIESGDVAADALAEETLRSHLNTAQSSLEIPEGVIRPEELEKAINTRDAPVEMDDVLRSRIPLKIAFSVLRLDPKDPAEAIFSRMVRHVDAKSASTNVPIAVAVFGRGRMMPGIPATQISENAIASASSYLCGACSCQVKEQNPGLDLLIATDWSKHLQDGLIVSERELPPLSGAGDLVGTSTKDSPKDPPAQKTPNSDASPSFAPTTLLATIGAITGIVVVASIVFVRRFGRI